MLYIYRSNLKHSDTNTTLTSEFDIPSYPALSLLLYDLNKIDKTKAFLTIYFLITAPIMLWLFYRDIQHMKQAWNEPIHESNILKANALAKRDQHCEIKKGAPVQVIRDKDDTMFCSIAGVSFAEIPFPRDLHRRASFKLRKI